jgi:hypothetical protein
LSNTSIIPIERIEKAIYLIRGEKVMLDRDLARLYDVTTAALNQAVRRNRGRFPEDFMFQLTSAEVAQLDRSQVVIGSEKHRDPRFRPYAFTEQGVAMRRSTRPAVVARRQTGFSAEELCKMARVCVANIKGDIHNALLRHLAMEM